MKKIKQLVVNFLILGLLFNSFVLTAKANENVKDILDDGVLDVAISGTLFPSNYYNDEQQLTGYNVEILEYVANELGVELKFHEMGVDGMFAALTSGQIDVIGEGLQPTAKRQEDFLIGEPIKYSFTSTIVRKDDGSNIHSFDDFKGKKAAGAATTNYMLIAHQLGAEMVTYDNATNEQYLLDVAHKRTDFIPNDYYLQLITLKYYDHLGVKLGDVFYNPSFSSFIYRKDAHILQEKVDKVIKEMKENGKLSQLSKQYYEGEDVSIQKDEINGISIEDLPVIELEE